MRPPRLQAANVGWQLRWPRTELQRIAAELGSDVPFFSAPARGDLPRPWRTS